MDTEDFILGRRKIAVIGMGYVGMPLAVAFSKYFDVVGFDINRAKIQMYMGGSDPTGEVGDDAIRNCSVKFTFTETDLDDADVHIIAVPTPINLDKTPDLEPVTRASELVGRHLKKGGVVVYESTVYPGVTEEICVPVLQGSSGLRYILDFKVGYSPERINPGDKEHRFESIKKIVSGCDNGTVELLAGIYGTAVKAGIHRARSIKVAEAAKVAENSQRDINIAFMNELAMVFEKMGIDTLEVVDAMNTKWNALGFVPGLVGGHCIGVDPYYFIYQAEKLGYHSQIIQAGRKVNDSVAEFVGNIIIKKLIEANVLVRQSRVAVLGVTFKENCPDTRNSKVVDIIRHLHGYGIRPIVHDAWADPGEFEEAYGEKLADGYIKDVDCAVLAVGHAEYRENGLEKFMSFSRGHKPVIVDIKGVKRAQYINRDEVLYWCL